METNKNSLMETTRDNLEMVPDTPVIKEKDQTEVLLSDEEIQDEDE